jgi:peroxiredoxin
MSQDLRQQGTDQPVREGRHTAPDPGWRRLLNSMFLPVAFVSVLIVVVWYWQDRAAAPVQLPPLLHEPEDARAAARHAAPGVGRLAPDFLVETLAGRTVALTDFRGQPVIVFFWATLCEPCLEEIPLLEALAREHHEARLTILAVNVLDNPDEVTAFARETETEFPILIDASGDASESLRVVGVPSTFFIDRDGILRAQFFGPLGNADLDRLVPAILQEPDTP